MAKTKNDMIKLKDFQDLMEHIYSAKETLIHGDVKDSPHVTLFKEEDQFLPRPKKIEEIKFDAVNHNVKGIFLTFGGWQSAAEMLAMAAEFENFDTIVIDFPLRYIPPAVYSWANLVISLKKVGNGDYTKYLVENSKSPGKLFEPFFIME